MLYKRLLIFLGANLLFCFSIAVLKEWRHIYQRSGDSRQIRHRLAVQGPTVQYSKLPLQDESLSRVKRNSASKARFDPVSMLHSAILMKDRCPLDADLWAPVQRRPCMSGVGVLWQVDDVTEQVISSDQAHLELPRTFSQPQTPRPSGTPPPHATAAFGGAGAGVALILFCYDRWDR
jgi:hypothetical protein